MANVRVDAKMNGSIVAAILGTGRRAYLDAVAGGLSDAGYWVIGRTWDRVAKREKVTGGTYPESIRAAGLHGTKKGSVKPTRSGMTLFDEGLMLGAMDIIYRDDTKVSVGFKDKTQSLKAGWHNDGAKGVPKRHFFGVNDDDQKQIAAIVQAALDAVRV